MPVVQNAQQNQFDDQVPAQAVELDLLDEVAEHPLAHTYQYTQQISDLAPQCPPVEAAECDKECWRFTLSPITESCFWPPKRRVPERVASDSQQECSMWALSMYESERQAVVAYTGLSKSVRNIKKAIGDHLARGAITCADGKCMPPNRKGHFDFHPYLDAEFTDGFQVIRALP